LGGFFGFPSVSLRPARYRFTFRGLRARKDLLGIIDNRARVWHSIVLVYDDERGLNADYEQWLEELDPTNPLAVIGITALARTTGMGI
jgi:hypothetical protein